MGFGAIPREPAMHRRAQTRLIPQAQALRRVAIIEVAGYTTGPCGHLKALPLLAGSIGIGRDD